MPSSSTAKHKQRAGCTQHTPWGKAPGRLVGQSVQWQPRVRHIHLVLRQVLGQLRPRQPRVVGHGAVAGRLHVGRPGHVIAAVVKHLPAQDAQLAVTVVELVVCEGAPAHVAGAEPFTQLLRAQTTQRISHGVVWPSVGEREHPLAAILDHQIHVPQPFPLKRPHRRPRQLTGTCRLVSRGVQCLGLGLPLAGRLGAERQAFL
mmetsp:Transcript_36382/g.90882  ORF Transcript_36382/g.90882 Transcript_36382/m.90882 type:complete len:203 (+) Transcript_36382:390-998(+)